RVDARHLDVVDVLDAIVVDAQDRRRVVLAVEAALEARERAVETSRLARVRESDQVAECEHVLAADHELVLRTDRIELRAAAEVRKHGLAGRAAIPVNAAHDAEPQQHPLRGLEQREIGLREPDRDALLLRPLHGAVRIEEAAKHSPAALARSTLDLGSDRLPARTHSHRFGETVQRTDPQPELAAAVNL